MEKLKYQLLAAAFRSYQACVCSKNEKWTQNWEKEIKTIIDSLPHGSGIDGQTTFNFEKSTQDKLVINSSYHCMNEVGMYDGWVDFSITLTPDWDGVDLELDACFNDEYEMIEEYILDSFHYDLTRSAEMVECTQ